MLKICIGKQNCECSCCRWRRAHLQLFAEGRQEFTRTLKIIKMTKKMVKNMRQISFGTQ